jgi:hypothetical protein
LRESQVAIAVSKMATLQHGTNQYQKKSGSEIVSDPLTLAVTNRASPLYPPIRFRPYLKGMMNTKATKYGFWSSKRFGTRLIIVLTAAMLTVCTPVYLFAKGGGSSGTGGNNGSNGNGNNGTTGHSAGGNTGGNGGNTGGNGNAGKGGPSGQGPSNGNSNNGSNGNGNSGTTGHSAGGNRVETTAILVPTVTLAMAAWADREAPVILTPITGATVTMVTQAKALAVVRLETAVIPVPMATPVKGLRVTVRAIPIIRHTAKAVTVMVAIKGIRVTTATRVTVAVPKKVRGE